MAHIAERIAQAIEAAGRDPYQNLAWMYPEQAAEVARRFAAEPDPCRELAEWLVQQQRVLPDPDRGNATIRDITLADAINRAREAPRAGARGDCPVCGRSCRLTKAGKGDVRTGQVWESLDKREPPRRLRVVEVDATHATVVLVDGAGRTWGRERRSRIRLDRFRPTATGYRLVQDVEG